MYIIMYISATAPFLVLHVLAELELSTKERISKQTNGAAGLQAGGLRADLKVRPSVCEEKF